MDSLSVNNATLLSTHKSLSLASFRSMIERFDLLPCRFNFIRTIACVHSPRFYFSGERSWTHRNVFDEEDPVRKWIILIKNKRLRALLNLPFVFVFNYLEKGKKLDAARVNNCYWVEVPILADDNLPSTTISRSVCRAGTDPPGWRRRVTSFLGSRRIH